jgi:hypothetical protein
MTPKLSDDLRQAIDAEGGAHVHVVDEKRQTVWVLIPAATFQQIQPLIEPGTFHLPSSYPLQEAVAAGEGWNSATMAEYDTPALPLSA